MSRSGQSQQVLSSASAFIAALPSLVGFCPTNSLVVTCLRNSSLVVSMRLDLPSDDQVAADCLAGQIVSVAARTGTDEILLVVWTSVADGTYPFDGMVAALSDACHASGLRVRETFLTDGRRYWSYGCRNRDCCPPEGTEVPDDGALDAERVVLGLPTAAASREDLEARFMPRPDLVPDEVSARAGARILSLPLRARAEQVWGALQSLAGSDNRSKTRRDGVLRTQVSLGVQDVRVRDYVLASMAGLGDPLPMVEALVRVALTAPVDAREPVAATAATALAAFGESTVAVECLLRLSGSQSLAELVAAAIRAPMPPSEIRYLIREAMPAVQERLGAGHDTSSPKPGPQGSTQ